MWINLACLYDICIVLTLSCVKRDYLICLEKSPVCSDALKSAQYAQIPWKKCPVNSDALKSAQYAQIPWKVLIMLRCLEKCPVCSDALKSAQYAQKFNFYSKPFALKISLSYREVWTYYTMPYTIAIYEGLGGV